MLDIKVGDFWSHGSELHHFRRIMDLVDTGIDQIVYWKDDSRCTGRCMMAQFVNWVNTRHAALTKRQSEKGFRLEHNERYKKCGNYTLNANSTNYTLANTGLQNVATEPSATLTTDGSATSTTPPAEPSPVQIILSENGLTSLTPESREGWARMVAESLAEMANARVE